MKQKISSRLSKKKSPRKFTPKLEAQAQIMDAAEILFYKEGARMIGVDAVVKLAGVNKMSLYRQFESKDALLLEYLKRRDEKFWNYLEASFSKHPDHPAKQLLQFFIDLMERAKNPDYRGCPFINIAVEFPDRDHPARLMVAENKRKLFLRLFETAKKTKAPRPKLLAEGLAFLIEGAYTASQTYGKDHPILDHLPDVAKTLLIGAIPKLSL
ncbi:TetR family transcriptional regulator [Leptospira kobayashii]|uniref:TetR family transcriptional regulator n=1 Tax=Leptospira kobayashii TaxID=1917830 RepID=A0ABM7UK94_9LEPT|nr:TetR/AcrR family transcriptional regulator [Leptospira kobayashii]BDA79242.1 TetR family transcriptional regulator [Leptospira kobayashii]